jgi:hypothetical protein
LFFSAAKQKKLIAYPGKRIFTARLSGRRNGFPGSKRFLPRKMIKLKRYTGDEKGKNNRFFHGSITADDLKAFSIKNSILKVEYIWATSKHARF